MILYISFEVIGFCVHSLLRRYGPNHLFGLDRRVFSSADHHVEVSVMDVDVDVFLEEVLQLVTVSS